MNNLVQSPPLRGDELETGNISGDAPARRLRVPGLGRLRRLAELIYMRLRWCVAHLQIWCYGSSEFIGDAENSCAPHGSLFLNPHAAKIMGDFRWHEYLKLNPDLLFDNALQAAEHFVFKGYNEQRLADSERVRKLDPKFYRLRYPELALRCDRAAKVHYAYSGYYEKKIANSVDDWVSKATLHIFQPGKVGSHALAATIEGKYPGGALHLHWPTDLPLYHPWCTLSYPDVVNLPRQKPIRVISAGRDIVAQTLSGAFQYLSTIRVECGGRTSLELVHQYLEKSFESNSRILSGWFDHKFYSDMDIYAHEFDHRRGFVRLSNDTIDLFLYRQEALSGLETELGQFLEIEKPHLQRANSAGTKKYGPEYRQLFDNYVVPSQLLQELYSTNYMRFFFSEEERNVLMERWSRPRSKQAP